MNERLGFTSHRRGHPRLSKNIGTLTPRGRRGLECVMQKLMMSLGCLLLLSMAAGCPTTAMPDASIGSDAQVSDAVATSDAPVVVADAPITADAPASIAIAGSYTDNFGGMHVITNTRWESSGVGFTSGFRITRFDNAAGVAIAQNDATNEFSPSLWSRYEWVTISGVLYMCQSPYDSMTEEDAMSAPRPDRTTPATSGCGTFGWSVLTSM